MKSSISFIAAVIAVVFAHSASAAVVITQYYEGASNNKWIEVTNTGVAAVDLSTYSLALFTNANAEGYKTGVAASTTTALSGSLAAGASVLFRNSAAVLPGYAVGTTATSVNFNGNDSMVLFNGPVIEDAIGFTNLGNEGQDRSFVRISDAAGFDTVAGSNATTFPAVWQLFTIAAVDGAAEGTNERLGVSSLVPEPSAAVLLGMGLASLLFRCRSGH